MKPSILFNALVSLIGAGEPVLIKGAPGIGKSDIVAQACTKLGYDLVITHPVIGDPTDYKGLPAVTANGADFLPFGELKRLIEATAPLVYFLDDLGQAPPLVQAACMQLILARRINGFAVSPQVRFIAATNRRQDRAAVTYCNTKVTGRDEYTAADYPVRLAAKGGGGTDFRPPFADLETRGEFPDCAIYLTDLEAPAERFPADPGYPVLWVTTGRTVAPFGEVIELKE